MGRRRVSDETLIAALLQCPTVELAAKHAGLSQRSIFDRLREGEFKRKYAEARRSLVDVALARMEKSLARAVHTLNEAMAGGGKMSDRIAAAKAVVDHVRWAQETDLAARMDQLESLIDEKEG